MKPFVCFAEGTLVVTGVNEDGSYVLTPIEDLAEGDLVYSRDQYNETDDTGQHAIVQVFRNVSDHLRIVQVRDGNGNLETIRTTDEHPFYIASQGWVSAKDLQPGQRLNEADNSNDAVVVSSTREEHPNGVPVYNFEVAGDHTYFVADGSGIATAVWVHNVCKGKNHLVPMGIGSRVPRGDSILSQFGEYAHTHFHQKLASHLKRFTKMVPDGKGGLKQVDMYARKGNTTADVVTNFTKRERIKALAQFYKGYTKDGVTYKGYSFGGKSFVDEFRVEMKDTLKRKLFI